MFHRVEISGFFYHINFACNQIWQCWGLKNSHCDLVMSLELDILWIFNTFKCEIFLKIEIQRLQNGQNCRFWAPKLPNFISRQNEWLWNSWISTLCVLCLSKRNRSRHNFTNHKTEIFVFSSKCKQSFWLVVLFWIQPIGASRVPAPGRLYKNQNKLCFENYVNDFFLCFFPFFVKNSWFWNDFFAVVNLEPAKRKIPKKSFRTLPLLEPEERKKRPKKCLWKIKLFKRTRFWRLLEMPKLPEMTILQDLENSFEFISTLKGSWLDVT